MNKPDTENSEEQEMLDEAWYNQSTRAQYTLDTLINDSSIDPDSAEAIIRDDLSRNTVDQEIAGERIVAQESRRSMSRILFVTKDQGYLEKGSVPMQTIEMLSTLFDEIHILVLMPLGIREKTERLSNNVWTYRATAQYWWWLPFSAVEKAKEELSFAQGFRPDIVVGLDPYESGLAALKIGKKFDRPVQIHVRDNFLSSKFTHRAKHNGWRKKMAKYVLKRAKSVRVETSALLATLQKKFSRISDIRVLPQFHNFHSLISAQPDFDVHERYKDYVFVALAVGPYTAQSHLHDTFSALNSVLHNPRIGMIVAGTGPAKNLFEEKAKLLGIEKNVIFLSPSPREMISLLKTSDVLVHTDTSEQSEGIALKAAAAGLPTIMYATDLRNDLFEHGVSASLCEPGDISGITEEFNRFLNDQGLRMQYKDYARNMVETRLDEDETNYYRAFRDSIELALETKEPEAQREVPEEDLAQHQEPDHEPEPASPPAPESNPKN